MLLLCGLNADKNDGFPKNLCESCFNVLDNTIHFIEQYKRARESYKSYTKELTNQRLHEVILIEDESPTKNIKVEKEEVETENDPSIKEQKKTPSIQRTNELVEDELPTKKIKLEQDEVETANAVLINEARKVPEGRIEVKPKDAGSTYPKPCAGILNIANITKKFPCPLCSERLGSARNSTKHMTNKHGITKYKKIPCKVCNKWWGNIQTYRCHYIVHHNCFCIICDTDYKKPELLKNHLKKQHNFNYQCKKCEKIFQSEDGLNKHCKGKTCRLNDKR